MKEKAWFVYIIENEKGHLYTGITTDINRRFQEHAGSRKGAKFFKTGAPVRVVFCQEFTSRSGALKFESKIKSMRRNQKLGLIGTKNQC